MSNPFSEEKIKSLAERIDARLASRPIEFSSQPPTADDISIHRSSEPGSSDILATQVMEIERITQEKPASFLKKFRTAAKQDLCEEGGVLNAQWQQWKDLASTDVVKGFGPVLVAMGFSGILLESLVVALGVTVIHIGLKVFCEEFQEDVQDTGGK